MAADSPRSLLILLEPNFPIPSEEVLEWARLNFKPASCFSAASADVLCDLGDLRLESA